MNGINESPISKKGILFIYDALRIGGCERVITVLAKAFASKGIPVKILMIKKDIIEFDIPENITVKSFKDYPQGMLWRWDGISIFCKLQLSRLINGISGINKKWKAKCQINLEANKGMWKIYKRYCKVIKSCLDENKDSIVISFMDNPNFATLLTSKYCKNTVIISERSHPDRTEIQSHFKKYRDKLYARADLCVFQLEGARNYFSEGVRKKGVIIENPIAQVLPKPYDGERRKDIITFCRIDDEQKNLTGLVNAFHQISEAFPDYNLLIYGIGRHEDMLNKHIDSLGLKDRVKICPYDSRVHEVVKDASMFVSFANYEGISNSMLEAMAIGMPVICSDCPPGGARLMINDKENGLLVPVGDEKALADALSYMISNPDKAKEMGKRAAEINDRCNPQKIADKWIEAIESIL